MVALPIFFVTSWVLYERVVLGKERKSLTVGPAGGAGGAGTETASDAKPAAP